jgi:hypothetical protein
MLICRSGPNIILDLELIKEEMSGPFRAGLPPDRRPQGFALGCKSGPDGAGTL